MKFIALLLSIAFFCLSPLSAIAKEDASKPSQKKYLLFPKRSVGALQIYQFRDDSFDFGAKYLANACGKVAVPVDAECGVVVNYAGAHDLSFWNLLPAGSLVVIVANNFEINDEQILALKHVEKLKVFEMSSTEIGDRGFAHLKNCANLRELVLPSCLITGAALTNLKEMKALRRLAIDHNNLDDASLVNLKGLSNLLSLHVQACNISDAGFANAKDCQRIYDLDIGQNKKITDKCLPTILALKHLRTLNLTDSSVTIVGLRQLKKLPDLRRLILSFDRQGASTIAEVRKLLPHCQLVDGRAGKVPMEIFEPVSR